MLRIHRVAMVALLLVAAAAHGSDGRIEISQTCAVHTGCVSGDTPGFPVTLSGVSGGSFIVTSRLVVPDENTDGIVNGTASTIDLNGFEIVRAGCESALTSCTVAGTGVGVRGSGTRLVNGSIIGMGGDGVNFTGAAILERVNVRWSGGDGIVVPGVSKVAECESAENGGDGIETGKGSIVRDSQSGNNGGVGIRVGDGAMVLRNVVRSNGGDGVVGGAGSLVAENVVEQNIGNGIVMTTGAAVESNAAVDNGGFGLVFSDASSGYVSNGIRGNTGGTVSGGAQMGNNICDGAAAPACP